MDGYIRIPALVKKAIDFSQPAVSITDHGFLGGLLELFKECETQNKAAKRQVIKPIIGAELYIVNDRTQKVKGESNKHLLVHARNQVGYKNLLKLHYEGYATGATFVYDRLVPRIDRTLLTRETCKGLLATTGCLGSEINQLLKDDKWQEAIKLAEYYKSIFDAYFAELQPSYLIGEDQAAANDKIVKLAEMLDIPLICTTDSHYLTKEEREEHQLILAIQSKKDIYDENRFTFNSTPLLSTEEMLQHFQEKVIANTEKMAAMCEYPEFLRFTEHGYRLPKYPITESEEFIQWKQQHVEQTSEAEAYKYCLHLVEKSWSKKLKFLKDNKELEQKYRERIGIELEVIKKMGFIDYFLIVQDFVGWCKQNDIMTGPGRGSAAGSLLAYLLGITKVDPIKYDLLFSRFLNADRVSLPDIDMDIDKARRDEVKGYLASKYGADRVASIATFSTMKVRACIKDVVRSLKLGGDKAISFEIADKINKTLEEEEDNISFEEASAKPEFKRYMEEYSDVARYIQKFEGLIRQTGIHAAGVIIGAEPLTDTIPLMVDKNGIVATAYDGTTLEKDGFLKMDLLGLKNLTIITDTFKNIEKTRGYKFKGFYTRGIDYIEGETLGCFEDRLKQAAEGKQMASRAYQIMREGRCNGIFQVESGVMRSLLRGVAVNNIEDVAAVLALCRPGPLASGLTAEFGKRKRSGEDRDEWYKHPSLKSTLGKTYGIVCLEENTPVYTLEKNYLPIKECQVGMTVKSIRDDGVSVFKKIQKVIDNGLQEVSEYVLSNGQKITLTDDHLVKTARGWMTVKEAFKKHEPIAVSRELGFGTEKYDFNKLRILAYLLGDGALSTGTNVSFIAKDDVLKEQLIDAVKRAFPRTRICRQRGQTRGVEELRVVKEERCYENLPIRLNYIPNDLLVWLRELNLKYKNEQGGCNSYTKFIPEFVKTLDRDHIEHFLAYLWDCDGGVTDRMYFYTTQSKQLAQDVFTLLNMLGLCPVWHYRNDGAFAILSYCLSECWESFGHHILAQGKNRQPLKLEKQSTLWGRYGWFAKKFLVERAKCFVEVKKISQTQLVHEAGINRENLFTRGKHITQLDYCKRIMAENVQRVIQDEEIAKLLTKDIIWHKIKSREYVGQRRVYDLTIDAETPNFVANGIFVHNCYQEQVMQIAVRCAGFTEADSDTLRKACGKKVPELMKSYEVKFVEGCKTYSGMDEATAKSVFEDVQAFAAYGFNKCLSGDTEIQTVDGQILKLQDIAGDDLSNIKLWSWDGEKLVENQVIEAFCTGENEVFEVEFEDGRKVKCTKEHKFLCEDGEFHTVEELQ